MHSLNQVNKLVSCGRDPARSLPLWRGFLLIPLILVCFAFAPQTRAVVPAPDGGYPGFNTAEGQQALQFETTGVANTGLGWRALFSVGSASFNTGVGAGALVLNHGDGVDANTAVGVAALLLNGAGGDGGSRNTGVGAAALLHTDGDADGNGSFNGGFGAFALNNNETGFSNNAVGDSALFRNINAAANTAVGDLALELNDSSGSAAANNNTAIGASALSENLTGSENTAVGAGAGPNIQIGFNNTYLGNFVGSDPDFAGEEDSTIRIGDISNGNGAGSLQCYVGGIWNNPQPVGKNVVVVTLDLDNDHLGYDDSFSGSPAAPSRAVPQPRVRPNPSNHAALNQKVEQLQATVTQQQATVAQQQKQIETLTAQLKEQGAQIQKVSAQLEMVRPTPRVVENR
jgi:hypothetical protein